MPERRNMSTEIHCINRSCKHHCEGDTCDTTIQINTHGKCASFEKGFLYYFCIVWDALRHSNFIDMIDIANNPDLRIGLYYVMDCYNLGYSEMEWGTSRIIMLRAEKGGKALNYSDIIMREPDLEKLKKNIDDFNAGIMPNQKHEIKLPKTNSQEFGWLSPTGLFTESPFGQHEQSASEICINMGFVPEYEVWRKENCDTGFSLKRDFLSKEKGYCLIHNPTGSGGYIVTHLKPLTKKQKEFLYAYFMDMGDQFKAEQFLDD